MAISVFKTFSAGEVLTASDLNSSFTQITGNGESLGWPATTSKDLDGNALILDTDADTTITADTDDQIDFALGGADLIRFKRIGAAVNGLDIIGSATGLAVQVTPFGSDANIDITVAAKGAGQVETGGSNFDTQGGDLLVGGGEVLLDSDDDTSITADTDDQIDFKVGGTDVWSITATGPQQRKNLIIGGDFHTNPWQRGTSFVSPSNDDFTADRWKYNVAGAAVATVSKSSSVPSVSEAGMFSASSLLVDMTTADASIAAGDLLMVSQTIEGYDWSRIARRDFTLSFWHRHVKTGTYCVGFRNSGLDRSFVVEYTQSTTDTWEKATVLVTESPSAGTWDYENGEGIRVSFTIAAGSNFHASAADAWETGSFVATANQVNGADNTANNFRLALVQVEEGPTATAFEQRSFAEELALCQRYFQKSYNPGVDPATSTGVGAMRTTATGTGTENGVTMPAILPTTMRTTPTVTVYSTTGASSKIRNLSVPGDLDSSVQQAGANGFIILNGAAATDTNVYAAHYTADAEL